MSTETITAELLDPSGVATRRLGNGMLDAKKVTSIEGPDVADAAPVLECGVAAVGRVIAIERRSDGGYDLTAEVDDLEPGAWRAVPRFDGPGNAATLTAVELHRDQGEPVSRHDGNLFAAAFGRDGRGGKRTEHLRSTAAAMCARSASHTWSLTSHQSSLDSERASGASRLASSPTLAGKSTGKRSMQEVIDSLSVADKERVASGQLIIRDPNAKTMRFGGGSILSYR